MSWEEVKTFANFVSMADKETLELVPCGEPVRQEKEDGTESFLFNMYNAALGQMMVMRCGVIVAGQVKSAVAGGKNAGKIGISFTRHGLKKETTYSLKVRQLDAAETKAAAAAELSDLSKIPVPEGKFGKSKTKARK